VTVRFMKSKITLSVFVLLNSLLFAQEDQKPQPPPPPAPPVRPDALPQLQREPRSPELPRPPRPPSSFNASERRLAMERRLRDSRAPAKPTAFLGVVTAPVSAALGAQLGLPDGFGLVVEEVLPDSPASAAGMQRHDVLKLFNDQQLIDPGQFATLIRARGKDNEATITLLRQGQEQKVTVKIGERMLPDRKSFPVGEDLRRNLESLPGTVRESAPFRDVVKNFQERMREFQQRFQVWQKNPSAGPAPEVPQLEMIPENNFGPKPLDILRESRSGGAREVKVITPGTTSTWNTSQARVFFRDDTGEVELASENGHRTVTAKNARGEIIFAGPLDTEEQRRALPEEIRKKVEKMEVNTTASGRDGPQRGSAHVAAETLVEPHLEKEIQ